LKLLVIAFLKFSVMFWLPGTTDEDH